MCNDLKRKYLMFTCKFLWRVHCIEGTPFIWVFLSSTHYSAELIDAMWIKCLARGHHIDVAEG